MATLEEKHVEVKKRKNELKKEPTILDLKKTKRQSGSFFLPIPQFLENLEKT